MQGQCSAMQSMESAMQCIRVHGRALEMHRKSMGSNMQGCTLTHCTYLSREHSKVGNMHTGSKLPEMPTPLLLMLPSFWEAVMICNVPELAGLTSHGPGPDA